LVSTRSGRPSGSRPRSIENTGESTIAERDLSDSLVARCPIVPPSNQRIPEDRAADRETDEACNSGRYD